MSNRLTSRLYDYEFEAVPQSHRRSFWAIFFVWVGFQINTVMFFLGFEVMKGLTLGTAIWVLLFAGVLIALVAALTGSIGAKFGLSTALIFKNIFGVTGSKIPQFFQGIIQLGWFIVTVGITGLALGHLLGINSSWNLGLGLITFFVGILFATTATYGFDGLKYLSYIAVPIIVLTFTITTLKVINDFGNFGQLFNMQPKEPTPLPIALTIAVGTFIAGATLASDITRYSKNIKDATIASSLSFILTLPANMFVGGIMALITGNSDLIAAMASLGFLSIAMISLILSNWTTGDNALYLSVIPLSAALKTEKWKLGVVTGIIGAVIAGTGIWQRIQDWLLLLGVVLPALAGPIIAEGWIKKRPMSAEVRFNWRWAGIVSWILGIIVGWFTSRQSSLLAGIPPLNAIIVSMVTYLVFTKYEKNKV